MHPVDRNELVREINYIAPPDQGGGWRDILGQSISPTAGPTIPVWTQIGATAFYAYVYQTNDQQWFFFHINHDYKPGTDIYLHVHWLTNGTSTNNVKWEFTWSFAKGFNQGAASTYNLSGAGAGQGTSTVEQAGSGTQYQHMTSEIATPVSDADFEVDGIMMVRLRRIAQTGAANADTVYVTMMDLHYQSDKLNTKNRIPDFYA
jgi:hypothetical protein